MTTIERISQLQTEYDINNRQLEIDCNLSNGVVSQWKSGKSKPSVDAITKMAKRLMVTSDYLLCLSDDPHPKNETPDLLPDYLVQLSPDESVLIEMYRDLSTPFKIRMLRYLASFKDMKEKKVD